MRRGGGARDDGVDLLECFRLSVSVQLVNPVWNKHSLNLKKQRKFLINIVALNEYRKLPATDFIISEKVWSTFAKFIITFLCYILE